MSRQAASKHTVVVQTAGDRSRRRADLILWNGLGFLLALAPPFVLR